VKLTALDLGVNLITDVTPLAGMVNLEFLFMEGNLISDISPLVANPGLGAGDSINLRENCLDLTPGTRAAEDLAALLARGAWVGSENQACGH